MIPCEIELTSTPFCNTIFFTYEIELPPSRKIVGFNLLDDEDFTIPYITGTTPNSPDVNQPSSQAKLNVWIIAINVEESSTAQGAFNEINCHQNPC